MQIGHAFSVSSVIKTLKCYYFKKVRGAKDKSQLKSIIFLKSIFIGHQNHLDLSIASLKKNKNNSLFSSLK